MFFISWSQQEDHFVSVTYLVVIWPHQDLLSGYFASTSFLRVNRGIAKGKDPCRFLLSWGVKIGPVHLFAADVLVYIEASISLFLLRPVVGMIRCAVYNPPAP